MVRRNHFVFAIVILLFVIYLWITIAVGYCASGFIGNKWIVVSDTAEAPNTPIGSIQWMIINKNLISISLTDGKLVEYSRKARNKWVESQTFGPLDSAITTFLIRDIDQDGLPEIIAGTAEPGFIYIYKRVNDNWLPNNYGKYVWATIQTITVGNFSNPKTENLLVQNSEGFIYVLQKTSVSLDLVWRSLKPWPLISTMQPCDIDGDGKDEVIVFYKNSGVAILKLVNNAVVSVWENYVWGVPLGLTLGDTDNDNLPEVIFGTSQRMLYILDWSDKTFQFREQLSLNYTADQLAFLNNAETKRFLLADTSGKVHLWEFDISNKQWQERFAYSTGRILQMTYPTGGKQLLLRNNLHQLIQFDLFQTRELKLSFQKNNFPLQPIPIIQNSKLYLAVKSIVAIPGLKLKYDSNNQGFKLNFNQSEMELTRKNPDIVRIDNEDTPIPDPLLFINNEYYLSVDDYQKILGISIHFDEFEKILIFDLF